MSSGVAGTGWSSLRKRATFRSLHPTAPVVLGALRPVKEGEEEEGGHEEEEEQGGEAAHNQEAAPETEALLKKR